MNSNRYGLRLPLGSIIIIIDNNSKDNVSLSMVFQVFPAVMLERVCSVSSHTMFDMVALALWGLSRIPPSDFRDYNMPYLGTQAAKIRYGKLIDAALQAPIIALPTLLP